MIKCKGGFAFNKAIQINYSIPGLQMSVALCSFVMSSTIIALMMVVHLPSLLGQGSLVDEFSRGDKDTTACHEYDECLIPDISEPWITPHYGFDFISCIQVASYTV